ncbi:MAG TPA: HAD family phosphatase [Cytophagaceae bacterium]|nr:HAD family phosphatase [Cytophagaceae bacterium]
MDLTGIKNLIFDLGGIIINIDFQLTFEAFAEASGMDVIGMIKKFEDEKIFSRFEKGALTEKELRFLINKELNTSLSDEAFDQAWNALLKDIPPERIEMLKELGRNYRLFLLSNTNSIHIAAVNKILYKTSGIEKLDLLFEKVYYSHEIGMAKPDIKIYEHVLKENGLKASESLFIDDNAENIKGASKAGLKTLHVKFPEECITDHLYGRRK